MLKRIIFNYFTSIVEQITKIVHLLIDWSFYKLISLPDEIAHTATHIYLRKRLCRKRLYHLTWPRDKKVFKYFPKKVPCPFTTNKFGETPLHLAFRPPHKIKPRTVNIMLSLGADANARDLNGRTPLHATVAANNVDHFLVYLFYAKTDLEARTNEGATPLILAAQLQREFILGCLLDAGAKINAVDRGGRTATHWAAALNHRGVLDELLERGADFDQQDNLGETPLFIAASEGHLSACRMLLHAGADRDKRDFMRRHPRTMASGDRRLEILRAMTNERMPAG